MLGAITVLDLWSKMTEKDGNLKLIDLSATPQVKSDYISIHGSLSNSAYHNSAVKLKTALKFEWLPWSTPVSGPVKPSVGKTIKVEPGVVSGQVRVLGTKL